MKILNIAILMITLSVAACVSADIQPLSATSFKVSASAAPACGRSGAQEMATQIAAIEVIRRGGDKFVFTSANSVRRRTRELVVQMLFEGQVGINNALSARQLLGSDWAEIVAEGIPRTCTG